jgi:hypothetical protein
MEIFDQIIKRDNTVLGDKDKVLKDRFIEGIKEPHLETRSKTMQFRTQNDDSVVYLAFLVVL